MIRFNRSRVLWAAVLLAVTAGPVAARSPQVSALHVEVIEAGESAPKVRVQVPLSVVEAAAGAIRDQDLRHHLQLDHIYRQGFDLRAFWQQIRSANVNEFFTVESPEASVRGWREGGLFRLTVHAPEGSDGDTRVDLRVPEALMDILLSEEGELSPGALIEALRRLGPINLVDVRTDEESVRVWID